MELLNCILIYLIHTPTCIHCRIDDYSTDNLQEFMADYISSGLVEIVPSAPYYKLIAQQRTQQLLNTNGQKKNLDTPAKKHFVVPLQVVFLFCCIFKNHLLINNRLELHEIIGQRFY